MRRRRLEEATRLLLATPSTTISEAAARWHFTDSSHFVRTFRKQYDCTPSDYIHRRRSPESKTLVVAGRSARSVRHCWWRRPRLATGPPAVRRSTASARRRGTRCRSEPYAVACSPRRARFEMTVAGFSVCRRGPGIPCGR
ncbi:helix-turn-helix domain-containing protein [Actinoplanes sp. NPDC089786]|uniref:helix-turn-helix domain-containing protein n=1 Tax=Actinoplanes sp. NPDC089786 TaxID=3155185 RepID=UPI0034445BA2